jgi:hypothetical protein
VASSARTFSQPPKRRRKRIDPHKIVGQIVIYGLAAESAIRFCEWLWHDLLR